MKKLFIKETDEVVEFGDVIQIGFQKVLEDGEVNVEKEMKLTPATVAMLLELGIIEEKEVENDNLIDFNEDPEECCEELAELYEKVGELEARIESLEQKNKRLKAVKK